MSKYELTREDIIDLLQYLGARKIKNNPSKDNIQFCCTVHNEDNPSAGISVSKQVFNCFSCHAAGSISWFLHLSEPDTFRNIYEADKFLKERYGVDFAKFEREWEKNGIRRFEDFYRDEEEKSKRFELPRFKLAPFKSGKETYQYFFERGFNKEDVKNFMIGRDIVQRTVTIPVFWEDGTLAGIIGRKIDPDVPKNARYIVYEFPRGSILYPIDKYKSDRGRVVLVEGVLDAMWAHKLGFTEVLAMLTNSLSKEQANWILNHCSEVVDLSDNDEGGEIASEMIRKRLKGKIKILSAKHLYPEDIKDIQGLPSKMIQKIIEGATSSIKMKIKRIEE